MGMVGLRLKKEWILRVHAVISSRGQLMWGTVLKLHLGIFVRLQRLIGAVDSKDLILLSLESTRVLPLTSLEKDWDYRARIKFCPQICTIGITPREVHWSLY